MFDATDWDLTSLAGKTITVGTGLGPLSVGGASIPFEFTNKTTGTVVKFTARGFTASATAVSSIMSKLKKSTPGASFSPSMFPSRGKLYGLQLARRPFDIEQLRHRFGVMVDVGIDLGVTGSAGVMVFSYVPTGPMMPILSPLGTAAAAVAACLFYTTGAAVGGWGPTGDQVDFAVS